MEAVSFAVIGPLAEKPRTEHYLGLPPELTDGVNLRQSLPHARVAVLVRPERGEGVFLYRFAADGNPAGDTWHRTVDEALRQAVFEYGASLGPWRAFPSDVRSLVDVPEFVRSQAGDTH